MGYLTTHVLDTAAGTPGSGIVIDLFRLEGDARIHLKRMTTNDDGRGDSPLLDGDAFRVGVYELVFHAQPYFEARGVSLPDQPFLDVVPIRFGISDAGAHYHVPLLLSPYGYTTYRGS